MSYLRCELNLIYLCLLDVFPLLLMVASNSEVFDVVRCFEERVFDVLVEDLNNRVSKRGEAVLVINMNVKDNHEEAAVGADDALHLCEMLQSVDDWEDYVEQELENFEKLSHRKPLYTICFY